LYLSNDVFWAIALTILFFTSPVLVYYGNNFLSNSSALAFAIAGWFYFIRFMHEGRSKWFYISIVVFFFAAAFKITALFSVFAIAGILFLEYLGVNMLPENAKLLKYPLRFGLIILLIFVVNTIWIVHAHNFNLKHDCTYFSTTIFPVWSLSRTEIYEVLSNIRNLWLSQYFHLSVLILVAFCLFFLVYYYRKSNKVLTLSILIILVQIIIYILLEFWTFADHDYYTIDIFILPVLIMVTTADLVKRQFPKLFGSIIFKILFSIFLAFNIWYAHQKIYERYNGWMNDYYQNKDIYSITPYLRQIGISPKDTIISIPDGSNASLYLMNQKGWTEYTDARFNRGTRIRYNQDSAGIQHSVDKGAAFLILNGISQLYEKPYLLGYCTDLRGRYKNVLVFNLKNRRQNFNLAKRTIALIMNCDAEKLSDDALSFINEKDSVFFQNGNTRSSDFSHSGKYCSKLSSVSPYGMTIRFKDLKNGESFVVDVWRKSNASGKGDLIASAENYYNKKFTILETNLDGWEKIQIVIFITEELEGKELGIYEYNPDPEPVYFDDLEITRYKSVFIGTEK